jgi:hypothetical protein
MRVFVAAMSGLFALAASFLFIDELRAGAAGNPAEIEADAGMVTMTGTVEAVDATRQLVTVVGPNNNWVVVKVGPEHIKLIKVREKITISYQDEVAVQLIKVSKGQQGDTIESEETAGMNMNAPTTAEQDWVELSPQGGATDLTSVEISDTIAAIDRNQRTITFAGTGGKTRVIQVGPNINLDQLNVGDEVVLEVTRAVAVNVQTA